LIGQTKADVRDTMVEVGDSSLMKVAPPNLRPSYEPSKRRVTFPNGAMCIIYSGDEPDQLRGPQHEKAWVDELAKFKFSRETWDNLEFGLRIGDNPQVVVTTTPRPIKIIKELFKDPRTINTVGTSYENEVNLSPVFVERVIRKYEGTHLGRQEIHGQIIDEIPGALWTADVIDAGRVTSIPDLLRIGVGVDPHASSGETGIVTAGIARLGGVLHGYILEDTTTGGKPEHWGSAVVTAYNKWQADIIIGEVNNGGDMVENTIRNVPGGRGVNYKTVHASRGKYTRAEPISALYGNPKANPPVAGRVHHVGFFPDLEDQQCSYVPGEDSPNNMDAAVWILTELMLDAAEPLPKAQPKQDSKWKKY
jgi:phage terminase large subunit-like protein